MIGFKNIFRKIKFVFKYGFNKSNFKYLLYKLGFRKKSSFKSKGERLIEAWLNISNVKYTPQYKVVLDEIARNSKVVYIDFMIYKGKRKIAIEYNGRQHYSFVPFFHKTIDGFNKQLRRDKLVREWCKNNNIELIEIPYTETCDNICQILKKITE